MLGALRRALHSKDVALLLQSASALRPASSAFSLEPACTSAAAKGYASATFDTQSSKPPPDGVQRRREPEAGEAWWQGEDFAAWQRQQNIHFELQPSALSPLHPIYKQHRQAEDRALFLADTIAAQNKLAEHLQAKTDAEVADALKARRSKLDVLARAATALGQPLLAEPVTHEEATGYYRLMQLQAQEEDQDFTQFARVMAGDADVWEYWFNAFGREYDGVPSLSPLERVFQKGSLEEEEARLRRKALRELQPAQAAQRPVKRDHLGRSKAIGRRKTSTAKVYLWEGEGRVLINRRPLDAHFPNVQDRLKLMRPLIATEAAGRFNVVAQVTGGGTSGQAQAVAHAIARALQDYDPPRFRRTLKMLGLTKRDPRMVERKKPGRAKARKAFTWVKR